MTPSIEPAILASGLALGYPGHRVLTGIELTVRLGEVVALLGPNGSGKSTLLKAIAGAVRPEAGQLTVQGQEPARMDARSRARIVAYVPQKESPALDFTVRETVLMGRIAYSEGLVESGEDHRVAEDAMRAADCLQLAARRFRELSGGEAQRVLIARALAQEAPVLLLDEPTAHLDLSHQAGAAALVRHLAAAGKAVLVAVHDLNWAAMAADRAVVLSRKGRSATSWRRRRSSARTGPRSSVCLEREAAC
jgi:iron complex transport system ATP-binding protein